MMIPSRRWMIVAVPTTIAIAATTTILFFLVGIHTTGIDSSTSDYKGPNKTALVNLDEYMDSPRTQQQKLVGKAQENHRPQQDLTLIIGFADYGYKSIAHRWYDELTNLGYTSHMVAAQDTIAADYFASHNIRHDLVFKNSLRGGHNVTGLRQECDVVYRRVDNENKVSQMYRRSLFGSRWHYVLQKLRQGYHVLLTDVDNIFTQYKPLEELEDSEYDVYHAYAGTVPSFPLNLFRLMGFTVCGGMSWLRSTPSTIKFVEVITRQCGCERLHCTCFCDDQVVLNRFVYYQYILDQPNITVPTSEAEMDWYGYSGYCNLTGHRFKVWDRDVAYRAEFDPQNCPNKTRNWIAMPTGLDRDQTWDIWKEKCLGILPSATEASLATKL